MLIQQIFTGLKTFRLLSQAVHTRKPMIPYCSLGILIPWSLYSVFWKFFLLPSCSSLKVGWLQKDTLDYWLQGTSQSFYLHNSLIHKLPSSLCLSNRCCLDLFANFTLTLNMGKGKWSKGDITVSSKYAIAFHLYSDLMRQTIFFPCYRRDSEGL